MTETASSAIKVFYCYAREDKTLREELDIHLAGLKRQYHLIIWSDHEILPGEDFAQSIHLQLFSADLVLLLISSHFLYSDYCYSKEMTQALTHHQEGTCTVIPILLHATYWEDAPFSHLQLLPTDARAITSWSNRYEAFHNVVKGISSIVKTLQSSRTARSKIWFKKGYALTELKHYEESLAAYEQAIRLNPKDALAYLNKGSALKELQRYEEAIQTYDQVITISPSSLNAYYSKVDILLKLQRYEEAIQTYDQVITISPSLNAYYNKVDILLKLQRYEEAIQTYNQAIALNPTSAIIYCSKGNILLELQRYKEAIQTYDQAIALNPTSVLAHQGKNNALSNLKRYGEANNALQKAKGLED